MLLALQDRDSLALGEGVQFFDPCRMKGPLDRLGLTLDKALDKGPLDNLVRILILPLVMILIK